MTTKKTSSKAKKVVVKKQSKQLISPYKKVSKLQLGIFAVIIGLIGVVTIISSFALSPSQVVEAESLEYSHSGITSAKNTYAKMYWTSYGTKNVTLASKTVKLSVVAYGDQCDGAPQMEVKVDGTKVMNQTVSATKFTTYDTAVSIAKGQHVITVAFINDHGRAATASSPKCDRNLFVDKLLFTGETVVQQAPPTTPIPANPVTATAPIPTDSLIASLSAKGFAYGSMGTTTATGGIVWGTGAPATGTFTLPAVTDTIIANAYGDQCDGAPNMIVQIDGATVFSQAVPATTATNYTATKVLAAGQHKIAVSLTNDYMVKGKCDRNLYINKFDFKATPPAATFAPAPTPAPVTKPATPTAPATTTSVNPLASASFYVNPEMKQRGFPTEIASKPIAKWFGGWNSNPAADVNAYVTPAANAGKVPIIVVYNIPGRDCGQYSAGGVASSAEYRAFIDKMVAGLGNRKAVVIIEPDATSQISCVPDAAKQDRYNMIGYAVTKFKTTTGAAVYIDAGNNSWQSADFESDGLLRSNIQQADGFSLNVSNFQTDAASIAYGDKIKAKVNKGYVIDTSRNGRGPGDTWCNPRGRGLGKIPTSNTGSVNVHAFLWIKEPGFTDGACNGGPANAVWLEYAQELIKNAVY